MKINFYNTYPTLKIACFSTRLLYRSVKTNGYFANTKSGIHGKYRVAAESKAKTSWPPPKEHFLKKQVQ